MGSHGGLLSGMPALSMFGGALGEVRLPRPEPATKRKQKTALQRDRKKQRQMRKKSRGR